MTLFAEGNIGLEKLSYQLNEEGYPFRDRQGEPRKWCQEDTRRVIANWPEYGGLVFDQSAKYRSVHTRAEVDRTHLDANRAVFPLELVRQVGYVRAERTMQPADHGRKRDVYPYPLSHITRCAHCEAQAHLQNDPRLRTTFGGTERKPGRVYRHMPGIACSCEVRSVPCAVLEEDFGQLIKGLVVDERAFALMVEMADNSPETSHPTTRVDMAQTRQRNILKLKKKIENTRTLFREADLSEDEYRAHMAEYRAELAYWEAYTTEQEEVALQLNLCLEAIQRVAAMWDVAEAAERRSMAHNLFEYIVYDLDKQRIVDFRLKPWANRFLVLRAALAAGLADIPGPAVHPGRLALEVVGRLTPDTILCLDGGNTGIWAHLAMQVRRERSFLWTSHYGHLGTGLPYALGAKAACPDRPVVLISGDGAFGFNLAELETAAREDLAVVVVVSCDDAWGMEDVYMEKVAGTTVGVALSSVRYDEVAAALGCHGEYVGELDELDGALERAFAAGRPAVVHVAVDPEANRYPPGLDEFAGMYEADST
ncbi:MAG: hypothetical protein KJZ47_06995 [Gemmatimonadales bacterium]|nr:hypothetical protein [Gemmatimonadales bacterium]